MKSIPNLKYIEDFSTIGKDLLTMDRRIIKTKQAIESAYFRLLQANPGKRISITSIAKEANIDRKTFYLHYNTCEDIIKDFAHRKIVELFSQLNDDHFFQDPYNSKEVFKIFNRFIHSDLHLYQFFSSDSLYDLFWPPFEKECISYLKDIYAEELGMKPIEKEVYITYFFSGLLAVYTNYFRSSDKMSLDEVNQLLYQISFYGIQSTMQKKEDDHSSPSIYLSTRK